MNAPAPESGGAAIAVRGLRHAYNGHTVLDGVDLDVPAGTVLALLGPSGCGKSTLLKALAGLLRPQSGSIRIGGQTAFDGRRHDPPEARGLGMVFQDYALWPHMSVAQNVGFPLEMRGVPRRERPGRVAEALALVGLEALAGRRPSELSGGQQQRVALARAIVGRPRLLLFDEPLSNLDRDLRETLCAEIGALLRRLGATAVYVTHDHQEAHALAHVIACMQHGQIVLLPEALRASLPGAPLRTGGAGSAWPRSVAPVASAANRAPLLRTIRMNLLNSPNSRIALHDLHARIGRRTGQGAHRIHRRPRRPDQAAGRRLPGKDRHQGRRVPGHHRQGHGATRSRGRQPRADVLISASWDTAQDLDQRGWLLPYESPNATQVPARFKAPSYVAQGISALGIVWNTKSGTPEPRDWADLTGPASSRR